MMLATFESAGIVAFLSGSPTTCSYPPPRTRPAARSAASVSGMPVRSSPEPSCGTSNSTICTWPSAKTSVCFAAGTPMIWETAYAVSSSEETMKSTSIWRSCQASMYSGFDVRTIVCASEAFFTSVAATRLISSRDVHAIISDAFSMPASWSTRRVAPLPATVCTS